MPVHPKWSGLRQGRTKSQCQNLEDNRQHLMSSAYRIQKRLVETLHRQAYAAQQEAHLEIFGVLVGRSKDILELPIH